MPKTAKKTTAKKTDKKASRKTTAKNPTKENTPKKEKATTKPRVVDDARAVAKTTDGFLDTQQVRILRALKKSDKKNPIDMAELKDRVGIGRDKKYSKGWLDALHDLIKHKLVVSTLSPNGSIPEEGKRRKHYYYTLSSGVKRLEKAEKDSKKQTG